MKKRILSLLLAFLMFLSIFPAPVYAVDSTDPTDSVTESASEATTEAITEPATEITVETTAESLCEICGKNGCTSDHLTWCPECNADNCGADHIAQLNEGSTVPVCNCGVEEGSVHAATCPVYICPNRGDAQWHETCPDADSEEETVVMTTEAATDPLCNCDAEDSAAHATTCPEYTCPNCGEAQWHETCPKTDSEEETEATVCETSSNEVYGSGTAEEEQQTVDYSGDIGKYVKLNSAFGSISVLNRNNADLYAFDYTDFEEGTILQIADWYWEPETTGLWYQVAVYSGGVVEEYAESWPETPWILQNYTEDGYAVNAMLFVDCCNVCKEPDCTVEHVACDICGSFSCSAPHVYCAVCPGYDCGKTHLYCSKCAKYDCDKEHTFCGSCGELDCSTEHETFTPATAPVIPSILSLATGADVSIVDASGNAVTEEGFILAQGMQTSLSAWDTLEEAEDVAYQWQICYDSVQDLWADIQGETKKGILISPAMFLSVLDEEDTALIRCVMTSGGERKVSDEIPVQIDQEESALLSGRIRETAVADAANAVVEDNENKVNLVVNYLFHNNTIAASPWAASLPKGAAYSNAGTPITIPDIAGYAPVLDTAPDGVALDTQTRKLTITLSAEQLSNNITVNVIYQPTFTKVTVYHYQQNVTDDNYTLADTEVIDQKYKTEETVGDVHKLYEGFYNLLYEKPIVAADGSTVVEVYYNRYYYLMTFDLDGGYGVEPIYARYGADIEIRTPTRPGFVFDGWSDKNGASVIIPTTMPVNGGNYQANWTAEKTNYTMSYWIVNEDGTRSLIGSHITQGVAGSTVNGLDNLGPDSSTAERGTICGEETSLTHTHTAECFSCGQDVHTHTATCFATFSLEGTDPGYYGNQIIAELEGTEIDSGYIYVIYNKASNTYWPKLYLKNSNGSGAYYVVNGVQGGSDESSYSSIIEGSVIAEVSKSYTDSEQLIVKKYKAKTDCGITQHWHGTSCSQICELHAHTSACYYDTKHLEYIPPTASGTYTTETNVTVKGDGSTVVNVYYKYKTYTIRFIYAKATSNGYAIANLTSNGQLSNCSWSNIDALPTFVDPSGRTDRSSVVIDGITYYYISLTAKFGADISSKWPSANIGNTTDYKWGSWAAAAGTGYRKKYGDSHANIVGPYPTMSEDMIIENPTLITEGVGAGTYLAQNMIAWWGKNSEANIQNHAYHNYFELLPNEKEDPTIEKVEYNGKYYKLVQTYTFTAAHNGNTRVDPIYFNGYQCINDSRNTSNDTQENSKNFDNGGNCSICGTTCKFCNNFYYDRNIHKIFFWNYNENLMDGGGSNVLYGASLVAHGQYVTAEFMNQPEYYPSGLEPDAYRFDGWYTTAECYSGTEMNWNTTMPDSDMTVYAKWVPIQHTVKFFIDKQATQTIPEQLGTSYAKFEDLTVLHGAKFASTSKDFDPGATESDTTHPYEGFDFIGWFYVDAETGTEKAFDPVNMPVNQDLDLYAKWSLDVLCPYVIYYVYDKNGNNLVDADEYVADPTTGSTLAGDSVTADAKGNTALYENYQTGYFPDEASKNMVLKPKYDQDKNQIPTELVFWYTPYEKVPYTVRYLIKEDDGTTRPALIKDSSDTGYRFATEDEPSSSEEYMSGDPDNRKAVVTENFQPIPGYKPDAFQKTLPIVHGAENVITFYYTKDEVHAPVHIVHYVQNLDGNTYAVYQESTDLNAEIGSTYATSALTITGFTFKEATANGVKIEGSQSIESQVPATGLQLNLYYSRMEYEYTVRYLEVGTNEILSQDQVKTAKYNEIVTEAAINIEKDMDGDGKFEDFQLYEATNNPQTATIKDNSTVITFYYVRCTQSLTIKKLVTGAVADPDQSFQFKLTSTAVDFGGENSAYSYTIDGTTYTAVAQNKALSFSLKAGQEIVFLKLPTAKYIVTEQNLPLGYYCENPVQEVTLTKDDAKQITVTNTYHPAGLKVSKKVTVTEPDSNIPEVTDFQFTIKVPAGVTGTYSYTKNPKDAEGSNPSTVTVDTDGNLVITLKKDQTATFLNLPLGDYVVTESDYRAQGYNSYYTVNGIAPHVDDRSAAVTMTRGETQAVDFINMFPVGDLTIEKTVTKEFYGTHWTGGTFTFTVKRTTEGRPLIEGNQYGYKIDGVLQKVTVDGVEKDATFNVEGGMLTVTISFTEQEAAQLDAVGDSLVRTLTIKNLPAGTYSVTETEHTAFEQSNITLRDLVIPAENVTAAFTNTLKRGTGSLYLEKELIAATGFNPNELPKGTKFSFEIELLEQPPVQDTTFETIFSPEKYKILNSSNELVDGDAAPTSITLKNGKFTVEIQAGQSVTVKDLPEGRYRITEATIPQYANKFAHKENNDWSVQLSTPTESGQMYTEISVTPNAVSEVQCTNTYPVSRAELILQKLVTKEYDRDTLPDAMFTFTVTLDEIDLTSYAYKIYNVNGSVAKTGTANVDNKIFVIPELEAGQYAVVENMPICGYAVAESIVSTNATIQDYNPSYKIYQSEMGQTASTAPNTSGNAIQSEAQSSVSRTFVAGKTDTIVFTNQYKRHLGELTIQKQLAEGSVNTGEKFLFRITGDNGFSMSIPLAAGASQTIYDLPLGTYTVTEDTSWNWRYSLTDGNSKTADLNQNKAVTLTFTNNYANSQWLTDTDVRSNAFTATSPQSSN